MQLPKIILAAIDMTAAAIGSTVGSGGSDITFTFKSGSVSLGTIDDTADSFVDGSTNSVKPINLSVEVVNSTGSNIDLGVDYYIDVTIDAVNYRLHFPEQVLVPSTTYTWYFDWQGISFTDSNLNIPAIGINDLENDLEVIDNTDENINLFLVTEDLISIVDNAEDYTIREVSDNLGAIDSDLFRESGIVILQTIENLLSTIVRGILWTLKTSTAINWRRKV